MKKRLISIVMITVCLSAFTVALKAENSETAKILSAARAYVDSQGSAVKKYKLDIFKKSGKWAIVSVLPEADIEGAGVILEKVGDKWVALDMGTDLSSWASKAPGLFE